MCGRSGRSRWAPCPTGVIPQVSYEPATRFRRCCQNVCPKIFALANIVIISHLAVVKRQPISGGEQPSATTNAEHFSV